MTLRKRIKKSPMILMVLIAVCGGLFFSYGGACCPYHDRLFEKMLPRRGMSLISMYKKK